jgi:hypothetical protein
LEAIGSGEWLYEDKAYEKNPVKVIIPKPKRIPQSHWSEADTAYLMGNYGWYMNSQLGKRLGRSADACRGRFRQISTIDQKNEARYRRRNKHLRYKDAA